MTSFETLESIVDILATNVAYSSLLFVLVLPATILLRNRSPQIRHALWSIVLVRLILPPSFSIPGSIGDWFGRITGATGTDALVSLELTLPAVAVARVDSVAPSHVLILAIWFVGVITTVAILIRARRRLSEVVREASPVTDASLLAVVDGLRERLGIGRTVQLLATPAHLSAFTIGTLRPSIVLPNQMLERLDRGSIECVIAHELAHVRRFDDFTISIQAIVQSLYFFHPVAWLAGGFRCDEAELICDQIVMTGGEIAPDAFGKSIVAALRLGVSPTVRVPTFLTRKRRMTMRIESIMRARPASRSITLAALAVALFLLPMTDGATMAGAIEEPVAVASVDRRDETVPRRVEGDVVAPKAVEKIDPRYPEDAKAEKAQGTVIVEAVIDENGVVQDVHIVESPREDFSEASMEAVRQWRFEPATLHGEPIAVRFNVTFRFRLE